MKHIAIYCRVSTKSQDTASQLPDLERWIKANCSDSDSVRWFTDKWTGKTMDRPGWNQLWAAVGRGEVGRIVVWRLDRLGRTARGLTALFDDLLSKRIPLVSIKDSFDLSTSAG